MLASLELRIEAQDEEIRREMAIYMATVSARVKAIHEAPRVEVPKPEGYDGKRVAKELNNFLLQMERYFEAIGLRDEAVKVRTATLYLTNITTLQWQRRFADMEKGLCKIDTWDVFKKEIRRQFYPEDVA